MRNNILFACIFLLTAWKFQAQTFNPGDQVMAFETDDALWYKATILESEYARHKIHWEGFAAEYDEWIDDDYLWKEGQAFLVGDKIQGMETDGKWYNLKVLKIDGDKYFIHWGGYDSQYDRWISYDSLRLPTKENYVAEGNFNTKVTSSGDTGSSLGSTRIGIIYLENKSGQTIRYSYSGDGASGGGSIYNNQKDNIKNAPIGGDILVNGKYYITISKQHDGQTIIIK